MLSNVFLHHVLDAWFESEVRPRLAGPCTLVRFADDFVMTFKNHHDARRVLDVLGKRLERYGLTLHPDKTRFIDFRPERQGGTHPDCKGPPFDFLGFTHTWAKSQKGKNVVRQRTAKNRLARALPTSLSAPSTSEGTTDPATTPDRTSTDAHDTNPANPSTQSPNHDATSNKESLPS